MLSVVIFLVAAPFAKVQLQRVWAFIPAYESALVICDLVTASLLFGQFHSFHVRSLYVLACGYLFTALTACVHLLTFPGVFDTGGMLGAGPQTTAWLYMLWHGGFPLFVIAYALLRRSATDDVLPTRRTSLMIVLGALLVLAVVVALALVATRYHDMLPNIMTADRYTPFMLSVVGTVWCLSLLALVVLWYGGARSLLDLWLVVVMWVWVVDVALSAMLNGGRFDVGFYVGRLYGLLASSFVLMVLLAESGMMYSSLLDMMERLRRINLTDGLTGITNRRAFDAELLLEWRRALRGHAPLALLMIDVDYFKAYNDTHGHVAGDSCLRAVAQALAGASHRAGDMVARYGGEEFVALLPQTGLADAELIAQRMRLAVADLGIPHGGAAGWPQVTVSIGVVSASCRAPDAEAGQAAQQQPPSTLLVEAADKALYVAKSSGRNRISANGLRVQDTHALHPA
ncbi:GGDEF domain-containing protein [Duganella sp. LX20W]|uniref:diguanylate cyclase n=2 Tax=Rugamonas brunnea TaxID=2758569 RepID=A0A7W2ER11_9BURK|nr:GGDEF domain-containing protein [Rugamonas brunnea]